MVRVPHLPEESNQKGLGLAGMARLSSRYFSPIISGTNGNVGRGAEWG